MEELATGQRAAGFRALFDNERAFRAWYEEAVPRVYGLKGSKTIATVAAASPGDARAHGISEGRSEESIGPFLCELSRIREDDRDLGVSHL